jgi:hypothetical protein
MATAYIFNKETGIISYTVDNALSSQMVNLDARGVSFHLDLPGKPIVGTYVTKNVFTGHTESIEKIKTIDYVNVSNNVLVANGTDVVKVSNLMIGSTLSCDGQVFVADYTSNSVEFTANGISLEPNKNFIGFTVSHYGYHSKRYLISLIGEIL